jgi:hypothetical protein
MKRSHRAATAAASCQEGKVFLLAIAKENFQIVRWQPTRDQDHGDEKVMATTAPVYKSNLILILDLD